MTARTLLLSAGLLCAALLNGVAAAGNSGYYSVAQIDGVWWFIDPQGQPFYSLGVSDINPGPARDTYDPKRPAYAAFRHYDSTENWAAETIQRLQSWNINTIGSWAHPSLTTGPLPYAYVLHLGGGDYVPWSDIFNPQFEKDIDRIGRALIVPRATDRNLLGWFSDNELKWYPDAIFRFQLTQPASSTTRAKLIELLASHYQSDFRALARDFEVTGAKSFDDLKAGGDLRLRPEGGGRTVISEFTGAVAERYYKVVHDTIRRYDANHLILGDRYPWHCPKVVVKAAAPYVDVISTNFDWPEAADGYVPCGYLETLHRITGRPVLVTEYYVAARENQSGNKNTVGTFLTVDTQHERATAFRNRLQLMARQSFVVGSHWFRFADEPPNGRSHDGEDYNFGLVDIENRPYAELTTAMKEVNSRVPQWHRDSKHVDASPPSPIEIPYVSLKADELRTTFSTMACITAGKQSMPLYDVVAGWNADKFYFAAMICHVSEREMYPEGVAVEDHELKLTISGPALNSPAVIRFGGARGAVPDDVGIECWLSANGLRHTLVVGLPATSLATGALKSGDALDFQFQLEDLVLGDSIAWETSCRLVRETERKTKTAAEAAN